VQFSSDFRSGKREDVKTRSSTIGKRGVGVRDHTWDGQCCSSLIGPIGDKW